MVKTSYLLLLLPQDHTRTLNNMRKGFDLCVQEVLLQSLFGVIRHRDANHKSGGG